MSKHKHFDDSAWGPGKRISKGEVKPTGEFVSIYCEVCLQPIAVIKFFDNGKFEDCIISCQNCSNNGRESVVRIGMHVDPLEK